MYLLPLLCCFYLMPCLEITFYSGKEIDAACIVAGVAVVALVHQVVALYVCAEIFVESVADVGILISPDTAHVGFITSTIPTSIG